MPLADAASYPVWVNGLIIVAAAVVIWIFGKRLTVDLDAIAVERKLDHAFVGMLMLGGITSLPELANTITSSSIGSPALGINNLLGSAAINVFLLAVADAFVGRKAVTSIVARSSTMMMAAQCMTVLVVIAFVLTIGDIAIAGLGAGSVTISVLAVFSFWLATGHDQRSHWRVSPANGGAREEPQPEPRSGVANLWSRVAVSGALIFAAGYALSQSGDAIAEQAGLTSSAVGFGLIGTVTSLPELVTVMTALRLSRPEMAFGQILGTNFVNLSFFAVSDLAYAGEPVLNTLGSFEVLAALLGAVLIGVFMVGLLEHRDRTIGRMGIDSAVVIVLFVLGVALLALV